MTGTHITAIVLAAGSGSRMHSDVPKQYIQLQGHPLLYYSLKAFEESEVDDIVLVTAEDSVAYCREAIVGQYDFRKVCAVVPGGAERYLSVYEGLKAAKGADYVLIHDGARPLLDEESIWRSVRCVRETDACVIGTQVKDTIKQADPDGYVTGTPERSSLWAVQTPQSFSYALLMEAYARFFAAQNAGETLPAITDDAMIVEQMMAHRIKLVEGSYENIKVTTPEDLCIAEAFLAKEKRKKSRLSVDSEEK
jgi:2-C-methyl-D-erythritol 4-phosphate cytidylyltransferase